MTHPLKEKVALVTGAARGIGRAIALRLAQDGAAVVVNYAGSAQQAQETVALIEKSGGRAIAVQADVSKLGDVKRLFDSCVKKFGRLDNLVNNAGMMFMKPVVEIGEEEFDRIFAVNVKGTFFCCQEAAKRMADGGRIINLSSSTTARAITLPGYAAYIATKGAVEQFSFVLAKELGPKKITVNVMGCLSHPFTWLDLATFCKPNSHFRAKTKLLRFCDETFRWALTGDADHANVSAAQRLSSPALQSLYVLPSDCLYFVTDNTRNGMPILPADHSPGTPLQKPQNRFWLIPLYSKAV